MVAASLAQIRPAKVAGNVHKQCQFASGPDMPPLPQASEASISCGLYHQPAVHFAFTSQPFLMEVHEHAGDD